MNIKLTIVLSILLATGCASLDSRAAASKAKKAPAASTPEQCAAAGGTWRKVGMLRTEVCDIPTKDAGKACRDSAECESVCVASEGPTSGAVTGQCYRSYLTTGTCLALVHKGKVESAQCAD